MLCSYSYAFPYILTSLIVVEKKCGMMLIYLRNGKEFFEPMSMTYSTIKMGHPCGLWDKLKQWPSLFFFSFNVVFIISTINPLLLSLLSFCWPMQTLKSSYSMKHNSSREHTTLSSTVLRINDVLYFVSYTWDALLLFLQRVKCVFISFLLTDYSFCIGIIYMNSCYAWCLHLMSIVCN